MWQPPGHNRLVHRTKDLEHQVRKLENRINKGDNVASKGKKGKTAAAQHDMPITPTVDKSSTVDKQLAAMRKRIRDIERRLREQPSESIITKLT